MRAGDCVAEASPADGVARPLVGAVKGSRGSGAGLCVAGAGPADGAARPPVALSMAVRGREGRPLPLRAPAFNLIQGIVFVVVFAWRWGCLRKACERLERPYGACRLSALREGLVS